MAPLKKRSVLVINPNTTKAMTDGLKPLVNSLGYPEVRHVSAPFLPQRH